MVKITNPVKEITNKLLSSHDTKQPIEFIRNSYTLSEETAYSVQHEFIAQKRKQNNDTIAGYKISMTSAETQAIAATDEPAYGTLLTTHLIHNQDTILLDSLFSPMIEPEIMFIVREDLTLEADEQEILSKCHITPGIEIPDARYINWFPNFSLTDLLCDNTATGLVVFAEEKHSLSFEELANVKMELSHNGEKISSGVSSAVLGNPVSSVAWLVNKLAKEDKTLKKDMIISSGTFIPPLPVKKGTYTVNYSEIGSVEVTFA